MLLSLFPATALAAEEETSEATTSTEVSGDASADSGEVETPESDTSLSWSVVNGVLTIFGTGPMEDYSDDYGCSAPWVDSAESITSVVIEDGVTTITDYAFACCSNMESVTIANTVQSIGDYAFSDNTNLTSVIFSGSAPTMREYTFSGVTATVHYPANDSSWDSVANQNYNGTLTWVAVATATPEDDTTGGEEDGFGGEEVETPEANIPENAIVYDSITDTLTWVLTDDGVLTVSGTGAIPDSYCFRDRFPKYIDLITSVVVSEGVTSIGKSVFYQLTSLTSVTLASTVKTIGTEAFYYCTALENVDLGGVSYIGEMAFYKCTALTEITFPNDGTSFGEWAFVGSGLETIVFEGYREITFTYYESGQEPFARLTANAWYPAGKGWDQSYCDHFGGDLTWGIRGTCGESLIWTLVDGVLTISGGGAMDDYENGTAPWTAERTSITTVVIGDGVTSIGDYAFNGCSNLSAMTIADSVETIGTFAIGNCADYLIELTIPASVTEVEEYAFAYSSKLATVIFEGDAPSIGEKAFFGVTATTCYYPADWDSWYDVTNAEDNQFGGHLTWIGIYGFCGADIDGDGEPNTNLMWTLTEEIEYDKNGDEVDWWLNLTIFGSGAMMNYDSDSPPWYDMGSIHTVNLPEGLTSIGNYAFCWCGMSEAVKIPSTVKTIGEGAFLGAYYNWYEEEDPALLTITIPAAVESIGVMAFASPSVEAFVVEAENQNYCTEDGVLFSKDKTTLVQYPCSKVGTEYTIPDGVSTIGTYAFSEVSGGLNRVTVPASVENLESYSFAYSPVTWLNFQGDAPAFGDGGGDVFEEIEYLLCTYPFYADGWSEATMDGTENATYGATDVLWKEVTKGIIDSGYCGVVSEEYPYGENLYWVLTSDGTLTITGTGEMSAEKTEGDGQSVWSMYYWPAIRQVSLPEGLTNLDVGSFKDCVHLESITIPSTVTTIEDSAFYSCTALTEIVIPAAVTNIGAYAFRYCSALTEITIPGSVTTVGEYAFANCVKLETVSLGEGLKTIAPHMFQECSALMTVSIPGSTTEIGTYAFAYCRALTEITLPNSVTAIGTYAFSSCYDLTAITLSNGLTEISDYAFQYCSALTQIAIPDSVTIIGPYAFRACSSLAAVYIGDSVTSIEKYAFHSCYELDAVYFGSSVKTIGNYAFESCYDLTVITLPDSVTTIGIFAFNYCYNLTLVSFGSGLTSLGQYAFYNTNLTVMKFTGNTYPSASTYTFKNVTATVYYPNVYSWTSRIYSTWGNASQLTLVPTSDNTAPTLSNAFAKAATDANLLWQMMETTFNGDILLAVMQNSNPEAELETLSDIVTLHWTSSEEPTVYTWNGGQALGITESHQGFNIWGLNVPVAYADGPAYMLALVDESGNISWELVNLDTNDVTAPTIAVEESEDDESVLLLEGSFKDEQGTITWANATPDTSAAMLFVDLDKDGMYDLDTDTMIDSYECSVLEDGSWSITLSEEVCEEYELKAGSEVSLLLMDGACNMAIYTVELKSSGDSEKPKIETFKAEPNPAGGDNDEIKIEIKVTDNVGVKKVELVIVNGLIDSTLETWKIDDDDKTSWSDSYAWDVTNLSSGEYTIKVTVEDKAGNEQSKEITVTVDNDAPSVYRLSADVDGEKVTLSWYCFEDDVTYAVYRADALVESYEKIGTTTETTYTEKPGQGDFLYYVVATDALGNEGSPCEAVNALVDTVPPELNVYESPENKSRVWGTIKFGVSASDVHGIQSVAMFWTCGENAGKETLSGETASIDTSNLAEGETLTVSFYAVDRAGNQSETITLTYTIDNIPAAPTNLTAEVTAEGIALSWKASSPEDNVEKYVLMRAEVDTDGNVGTYEAIDSSIDKVTLGSVLTSVIANVLEDALKATIQDTLETVLTGNPDITIKQVLTNLDSYGLEDAAKTALEAAIETIQCDYLDTDVEFGVTYSYKMLAQGYSGLVSESNEASATFVDETNPVVNAVETLSQIGEALFGGNYSDVPFKVDASDAGKGSVAYAELSYTVGDSQFTDKIDLSNTYTVDVSDWASGTYTFTATAYDAYGNASAPFETTITVDNTAPTIDSETIDPAVGSKISGESVQFTVPATDNLDTNPKITLTYDLNGTTLTIEDGVLNTVGLPEGEFTLTATATDLCGNIVSQVLSFIVDNIPGIPVELTVTSDGTKISVNWNDSEEQNAGGFVLQRATDSDFTIDLKEWTLSARTRTLASSYEDQDLVHGTTYYYRVKAVSYDGRFSSDWSEPVSITFEDTVAPVLNGFTASQTVCGSSTKEITLTVDTSDNLDISYIVLSYIKDEESVVELTTLTDSLSYCWDISELTSGVYTVTATVYDAAGNSASGEVVITVDKDAPNAPANVKAEGSYEWIRLTWNADEDLVRDGGSYRIERDGQEVGSVAANRLYFDDSVTDSVEHTYQVFAVDAVGNEAGSETVSAQKKTDTEAPAVYDVWPRSGMTVCHDVTVQVSALDNWKVNQIEAGYSLDSGKTITWFAPATTSSANPVAKFDWDLTELSGTATLYFKVTDATGLTAERTETVEIMTYAKPEAPVISEDYVSEFKSATINWTYGDTTLLKQFKVYKVENGEEVLWANLRSNSYTMTGLTEATTIRVYAEDIYGAISDKAEIVVAPVLTETEAPVAVILPKALTGVSGSPVAFYGGNSTDNDAVKSYLWTFHDGTTASSMDSSYTYNAAGTYEVKLTVTDNSGNSATAVATVTIYDVTGEEATHTVLTVTVTDGSTADTPVLSGVTVTVSNDDGFETSALTDENGVAMLVVPQGTCTLTAIKSGYAGAVRKVEVTSDDNGYAYQAISLTQSSVSALSGSLTAERMTYDEIVAAGIDVTNPANNHVVKQEFALRFLATVDMAFELPVSGYYNASGQCVGGSNLGWGTYTVDEDGKVVKCGESELFIGTEETTTIGIFPVGKSYYLVIYGETHWLKEMFHVELILVNNSYEEDVKDCIASLNLPEGLSLATMLDYGQCPVVSIGDIDRVTVDAETGVAVFDQEQVSWYVRGDVMGEYYLSADVTGNFVNDANNKTPIDMTFETTSPIKVYAGSALHLLITAQDTAYSEKEYRVQFKLTNVSHEEDPEGKGIDLYNLSFGLTGAEQYTCIIWSDGTETRYEDLDIEDFGDKMTFRVPVLQPGQSITVNYVTTCLFESDLASALVDKATFGIMEVTYKLTDVFVTTLEGSTTEIPTDVVLEPVPKATFTEWLWGEIKDAFKDGIKDTIVQAIDGFFFGGIPVTEYGLKVFEIGSDLLEDKDANSKAVVTISEGAYFLDSDNVIHTSNGTTIDPASAYSLRRNIGGVTVYTDAEDYTISEDGKTMTINGKGNLYVLRTGDTGDVEPQIDVTTNYLAIDSETGDYVETTFTRTLMEPVDVDANGEIIDIDYSAGLTAVSDVLLRAPAESELSVPGAGETLNVTFPHFMADSNGYVVTRASNVIWSLTDAEGNVYSDEDSDGLISLVGMDLNDGTLTVNSMAQAGTYTVTLAMTNANGAVVKTESQTITLTQTQELPEGDYICWNPITGEGYESLAEALLAAEEGETVQLMSNCEEQRVFVTPGVTLDLNGYTLTADYVIGFKDSDIVDTSIENTSLIVVSKNNIALATTNSQLPVWNGIDGYLLIDIDKITTSVQNGDDGAQKLGHLTYFEEIAHKYLVAGKETSGTSIVVRLSWIGETYTASQDFVYSDAMVKKVIDSYSAQDGKYDQVFTATFAKVWLESAQNMTANVIILSETGVEYLSEAVNIGG